MNTTWLLGEIPDRNKYASETLVYECLIVKRSANSIDELSDCNDFELDIFTLYIPWPLSSAEVSMSFTWRLPYRTAVWKTRRRRRGKQEAKPLLSSIK
jgi:hypothetical protein